MAGDLYINGVSFPKFTIRNIITNVLITEIDLDLCGVGGLTEEYEEDFKRVFLDKNSKIIDYDFRGARIIFTLDYSEYITKNNSFEIELLSAYNSQPGLYKLILTPRADVLSRSFEVRALDGKWAFGVQSEGENSAGHRLPIVRFITVITGSKNFVDPLNLNSSLPNFVLGGGIKSI